MAGAHYIMDLSIITISRDFEVLSNLLESLKTSNHNLEIELLISFNGDKKIEDNKIDVFDFPITIQYIEPYNFAKNNNTLANKSKGKTLLFINDDVILDKNSLQTAWNALHEDATGIVGINLRYHDNKIQHGGVFFKEDGTSYHRFKHRLDHDDRRLTQDMIVPAVTGAFIMIDKLEFLEIKFDERFITAGEDIVLCLQYQQRFHKNVLYVGQATAIHAENVTRKKLNQHITPVEDVEKIKIEYNNCKEEIDSILDNYKVRIVTEKSGWILHRMALELQSKLKNVYINEDVDANIHYYINYGYYQQPMEGIAIGNFTHYDPQVHNNKFIQVAMDADHCISISEETSKCLKNFDIDPEKISNVVIGADKSFKPKLTLGIVGRTYRGGRKGEHLIAELLKDEKLMENVQIISLNEGWGVPVSKLEYADFYRCIDYLLIPSIIEGGPVPFMEALACGTLSIAPPIGIIPQFPHVGYRTGDIDSLKATIKTVKNNFLDRKQRIAEYIKDYNWDTWASNHDKIFKKLLFDI